MNQDLRNRFEARDAFGIVSSQVADGALPLMCESVFESAQFALMLIHQAQSAGRGLAESTLRVRAVDAASGTVLLDSRLGGSTVPVNGLPVSCFTPEPGESLVPFLVRAPLSTQRRLRAGDPMRVRFRRSRARFPTLSAGGPCVACTRGRSGTR